jgi:hypothetical protein
LTFPARRAGRADGARLVGVKAPDAPAHADGPPEPDASKGLHAMTGIHEPTGHRPQPTPTCHADRHPPWCDRSRCTADPASQANGYQPHIGGEHRSAPIPLNLTTAQWPPVRDGTAWPTEACAPWRCEPYLRVQVGEAHLSMPACNARRVIDALSTLLAPATTTEEVTP